MTGSMCCGGATCIGLCGNLVGRHNGAVMTVDDLGHHAKRWKVVEPWIRDAATRWKPGDLGFDLLNEIDRLRFLLKERDRSETELLIDLVHEARDNGIYEDDEDWEPIDELLRRLRPGKTLREKG